jgi:predicted MFS family arabinose efflux permease
LNPRLPPTVWLLQAGGLINAFGIGAVLPFVIIYLHTIRGLSLTVAGFAAAANGVGALPASGLGGALADRYGPKRLLAAALVVQTIAICCFPLIRAGWHAIALELALGAGAGMFWPSQSSLLTLLTPPDRIHAAFAQQRATMNLGIGLGGVVGGLIAVASRPWTFDLLFAIDGATFLLFAVLLAWIPSPPRLVHEAEAGSYAAVVRDRPFLGVLLLNTAFIAAGIVPLVEFLPVYAKSVAGVSEQAIGLVFFANTMVIVLFQVPVAHALEGRRRMPALAIMGAVWAAAWLAVPLVVERLGPVPAALALSAAGIALGLGECMQGAVQAPLVAELAVPGLLGRYMALSSGSWQLAFVIGPAIGGRVLDRHRVGLWLLASATCAVAAVGALMLESAIPEAVRRTRS